jgi:predicted MFS family arabinose efflux permease
VNSVRKRESRFVRDSERSLRYRGWRIALVSHIGVLTGFATVFIYSFSFMIKPMQQEFGWSREQIARAFSFAAISVAICSPFIGRLFDRIEPRKLIAAMMAALGVGLGSLAYLGPHLDQLYASAIFIGIAGTGTYQLGYARIVAGWFERRLGTALSIVVAGSGAGSLLIPPLVAYLIEAYGWRHAYLALAALPLCIGAPLTLFFAPSRATTQSKAAQSLDSGESVPQAISRLSFWLLALGVSALSLSENGSLAHLAPMLSDHGLSPRNVAFTASLLGVSSVIGRLALGSLLDFVKGSFLAVASLAAAGSGVVLLVHAHSFSVAAPAAVIAGLGGGCELDLVPYMLRRYFGMRSFSTLYGLVYTFFAAAGAVAPLLVGHAFDSTGSYTGILNLLSAVTLVAALAMFALPAYRYAAFNQAGSP